MLGTPGSAPQEAGMRSQHMPVFSVVAQSSYRHNPTITFIRPERVLRILQNLLIHSSALQIFDTDPTQLVGSIASPNQDTLNFIRSIG